MVSKNLLQHNINELLNQFHSNEIDIYQLHTELLKLNPHPPFIEEYEWYNEWIDENIQNYKNGDKYVLSLTSSGSILNSFE